MGQGSEQRDKESHGATASSGMSPGIGVCACVETPLRSHDPPWAAMVDGRYVTSSIGVM